MSVALSDSEDRAPVFRWPSGFPRPGGSAGKIIASLPLPALMIVPESVMEIEDDVTEIDIELQDQETVVRRYNTRSNAQQHGEDSGQNALNQSKPDTSDVELDLCLDHPIFYCRSSRFDDEATYQDPNSFGQSVDMQQVQWSKLRRLNNDQTLGLIQLLYQAGISMRREKRRLERDLGKVNLEREQDRARLQAVIDSEAKHKVEQDKRYQALQDLITNDPASRVPQCSICMVNDVDTSLRCGHSYCADCMDGWNRPYCPLCKKPKGKGRRLYFS